MERELQPAFGVTVECDGETVAEVRDGVGEREDESDEPTTAEQASAEMGGDGSRFTSPDGARCTPSAARTGPRSTATSRASGRIGSPTAGAIATSGPRGTSCHADCTCLCAGLEASLTATSAGRQRCGAAP
jgi:hypothetical protein